MTTNVAPQAEAVPEPAKTPHEPVSVPCARMAGGVDLAEAVDGDQRVDLRGRYRGVAEQLLDHPDVGPAVEQVGGEGVPQGVRGHLRAQPRALRGRPEDRPGALPGQRAAAHV